MRLLHFDYTGRLILTDFSKRTIPPYAILSHRWGDDEVLFEDLVYNRYESKIGYRKIKFCAKQAAQDRLQYFWIDTCCIDKWNVHELSKAINSMFRWYRNATKCYVFLSDVSVSTATDIHRQSTWEASFRASKWFTRGWTLQELIAPESVEFFSSEGRRLGDKRSLEQLVHEITSIPVQALQSCPLEMFKDVFFSGNAISCNTKLHFLRVMQAVSTIIVQYPAGSALASYWLSVKLLGVRHTLLFRHS